MGVIVYQEQVMAIANKVAGFSGLGQARHSPARDGQKEAGGDGEAARAVPGCGAKKNKIPDKKAEKLYELIQKFCRLRVQQVTRRGLCSRLLPDRLFEGASPN